MRTSVFQVTLIAAWLLAGQAIVAQEESPSAEAEPSIASSGSETREHESSPESPSVEADSATSTTASPALESTINGLPANLQEIAPLTTLRRLAFAGTSQDRRPLLWDAAREISGRIAIAMPQDQLKPLVDATTQLAAQLYRESQAEQDWETKALNVLSQLELRLAREFPARIELASQVGIERLRCQLYSLPPEQQDEINPDSPQLTSEFIEQYPHTAAAAQAAYLAATQYERWALAHLGSNYRPRDDVPEMDEDYFQQAVEQSPNSIWGKAAAGALRRIRLVGQTLQVSGRSLDGKFLSLKQFRSNREVVVFFRPGKSSWGAVETPDDFAAAVRQRGIDVLGVLCHLPTAAPDEIAEYVGPASKDGPHMPLLVDSDDVDTSNSVRYGLTVQRLFVLVDATGKVVRTATDLVKDIDAFLGPPLDTLVADAGPPADAAQERAVQKPLKADDPPAAVNATQEPVLKIFHLQHGTAGDYAKLVQDIFSGTKISADTRTNSMIISGPQPDLQKVEALLLALDQAATRPADDAAAQSPESDPVKREVYFFTANWCGPCQQAMPALRSIVAAGQPIQFVDVDREPGVVARFRVTSIPTTIVVEDGLEVGRRTGVVSQQQFENLIFRKTNLDNIPAPIATDFMILPPPTASGVAEPGSIIRFSQGALQENSIAIENREDRWSIATRDAEAERLAARVRDLSRSLGSEHPDLQKARQQLVQSVASTLEFKLQSEQQQLAALEQRLGRLRTQLAQRQAAAKQIVNRRMQELLETPITRWNTDESSSDSPQATEAASTNLQPAVHDQITVDLYATDGIYQNDKLIATVVVPLNKLTRVVTNVRMIPGDSGQFVFAIVHDPSQRFYRETQQTGKESATRQAISAALKAGGINDVRWEGVADFVAAKDAFPAEREAAAPASITPPDLKPADSLEASARVTLELADAQAGVREAEAKLAHQTQLHAEGAVTTAELTDVLQQRDRAVRRRQVLLDEYAATVKDLELQTSLAHIEHEAAKAEYDRMVQLVETKAATVQQAQESLVRATQAVVARERLQNRLKFLQKAGEGSAAKEPSPNELPGETSDLLRGPSQPPQAEPASVP